MHVFWCTFQSQFLWAHVHTFLSARRANCLQRPSTNLHTSRRLWAMNLEQFAAVSESSTLVLFPQCFLLGLFASVWHENRFQGSENEAMGIFLGDVTTIGGGHSCSNAFLLPALQSLLGHFVFCLARGTGANSCNATLKTKRSNLFRRQCWRSVQLSYQETIKSLRSGGNKQFEPLGWLCIFPSFESAKVYFVDIMKLNCPAAKWAKSNLLMQTRNSCIEARAALACSKVWIGWNASKDPRMSILRLQGDEVCN